MDIVVICVNTIVTIVVVVSNRNDPNNIIKRPIYRYGEHILGTLIVDPAI